MVQVEVARDDEDSPAIEQPLDVHKHDVCRH